MNKNKKIFICCTEQSGENIVFNICKKLKKYNYQIDGVCGKSSEPYFTNKYLYPTPCKLGPLIVNYVNSMKDISDGLIGDLTDMLSDKYGALINVNKIPLSVKTKKILNNKNNFRLEDLINAGDDYELIIISSQKNRNKIFNIAKKNNIKVTLIGKIISEKGIHFDSHIGMKNIKKFDHFS